MLGLPPAAPVTCTVHKLGDERNPALRIFCCKTKKTREILFSEDPTATRRVLCFPLTFSETHPTTNEGSLLQLPSKSPGNDALHADVAPELIPAAQNVSSQVGYLRERVAGRGRKFGPELVGDVVVVFLLIDGGYVLYVSNYM